MKTLWNKTFFNHVHGFVLKIPIGWKWEAYMPDGETLLKTGWAFTLNRAMNQCTDWVSVYTHGSIEDWE